MKSLYLPFTRRNFISALSLISLVAFSSPQLEAKTLKHKPTGFRVNAPGGFRLKASKGIYTIKKGRDQTTVMRVRSPLNAKDVARSLAKSARMKRSRVKGGGAKAVLTGSIRGKAVYVEVQGKGPVFKVSKMITRPGGSQRRSAKMSTALTARDVAVLRRIANSARGGIVSRFAVDIPRKRFRSGGTFATVPDIAGWRYLGEAQGLIVGMLQGSRAGQGFFALGTYNLGVTGDGDPGNALFNVWPTASGLGMTIQNAQFIPGTFFSGPGGSGAARFTVRLTIQGISYDAIIFSQTIPNQSGFGYDWYSSYIAVRTGAFPGLGDALFDTWTSWNHDASQASRNAATLATIRSTPTVAIDRDAFDRINSAWVDYIRR